MRTDNSVTINRAFFGHCRTGIRHAMQSIAKKESLNVDDIKALRILGAVYEAMISPDLEACGQILEDCKSSLSDP